MHDQKNQEMFMLNISNKLGRKMPTKVTKPTWSVAPQWKVFDRLTIDELLTVLMEQCKKIHTNVVVTNSVNVHDDLMSVLKDEYAEKIITWKDNRFAQLKLDRMMNDCVIDGMQFYTWDDQLVEKSLEFAERADVGITLSDMTLAESGTIVLFSGDGRGRAVSLLPKHHVAIIPKSTLVPRLTQAMKIIHEMAQTNIPSCINFISGPSNSADIEMNLVVGVHGPVKATYVVVKDQ